MKPQLKNIAFLIVGILSLIVAFLVANPFSSNTHNQEEVVLKEINSKVASQILELKNTSSIIAKFISESNFLTFSELNTITKKQFYIFKGEKPIYWSTNSVVPQNLDLENKEKIQFLNFQGNLFLSYSETVKHKDKDELLVVVVLPLYYKYNISNSYLKSSINEQVFPSKYIANIGAPLSYPNPVLYEGKEVFSLTFLSTESSLGNNLWSIVFFLFAIINFFVFALLWIKIWIAQKRYFLAIFSTVFTLFSFRFLMLFYEFPFEYFPNDLFDARFFASSIISPSIGDYLINAIIYCIVSLMLFFFGLQSELTKLFLKQNKVYKFLLGLMTIAFAQSMVALAYATFQTINFHSQWTLDITDSIQFNYFRILSLLSFLLVALASFFINHILLRLLKTLITVPNKSLLLAIILGSALPHLVFWDDQNFNLFVTLLYGFYIGVHHYLNLGKDFYKLDNKNYLYLIVQAVFFALVGAISIFEIHHKKLILAKSKFAYNQIIEREVLEEYILTDIQKKIENDIYIQNIISSPLTNKNNVRQKIKKSYLTKNLDKYESRISIFDNLGEAFFKDDDIQLYNQAIKIFAKKNFATEFRNLFFINNSLQTGYPKYVLFHKIIRNNETIGYIIVRLFNKKYIPYSVFPQLLVDGKSYKDKNNEYDFAIFHNSELLTNYGSLNYEKDFVVSELNNIELYNKGIKKSDYHHWGFYDKNSKNTIVVSSEAYSGMALLSNFSFLFILFLIVIVVTLAVRRVYNYNEPKANTFSSKIQLLLNTAFFIPLLVITATTLSIITQLYQKNLEDRFTQEANRLSKRLVNYLEDVKVNSVNNNLSGFVSELSKLTESDLNFYNVSGKLLATSQADIYKENLISDFINPVALAKIRELKNTHAMFNENIGSFEYHAVYMAVKSYSSGKLMGIISIPFFESTNELETQLIEVFCTIINIFSIMFIVFLGLLQTVSQTLVVPLKLLTKSIKQTNLAESNQAIFWKSKDEIGLLVNEYNQMLAKLEKSKIALQNSEKEKAWRDVAQQVAHEIKNPLTPMKLTIQHLQSQIQNPKEDFNPRLERGLNTLLNQIDLLSDIAGSFSAYAKLPIPKLELIDIAQIFQNSVQLFMSHTFDGTVSDIPKGKVEIMGDAKLLTGIFSNLLINAYQAIPSHTKPLVNAVLRASEKEVLIEITDNGVGIAPELTHQIFVPHFSTKSSGSGIGLALAKQGIEYMGGKIWFSSIQNQKTSFYIQFQRAI